MAIKSLEGVTPGALLFTQNQCLKVMERTPFGAVVKELAPPTHREYLLGMKALKSVEDVVPAVSRLGRII